MKIYLDTCVIIDYLANRQPFFKAAEKVFELIASNKIFAYVSSTSITDIYYIIKKNLRDEDETRKLIIDILSLIEIIDTYAYNIKTAFDSKILDFEDALIEELSFQNKLDYIVTRNTKDFRNSRVEIISPAKLIELI